MSETEDFIDEQELFEESEAEAEPSVSFEHEPEPLDTIDTQTSSEVSPGLQAILDHVGGKPEDWDLAYRGDSEYTFDGENIVGPDGSVWMNEDRELHEAMLSEWRDGERGSAVFQLPDYRERDEERETLYITHLILGERGEVTYEIHKHESIIPQHESESRGEDHRAEEVLERPFLFEEFFDTRGLETSREALTSADQLAAAEEEANADADEGVGTVANEVAADPWLVDLLAQEDDGSVVTASDEPREHELADGEVALVSLERESMLVEVAHAANDNEQVVSAPAAMPSIQRAFASFSKVQQSSRPLSRAAKDGIVMERAA